MRPLKAFSLGLLFCSVLSAEKNIPVNLTRLSDRALVLQVGATDAGSNIIALAGTRGLAVIDTGNLPSQAAINRKVIAEEFQRDDFIYVINTHYHFDHTNGNQAFADTVIIGHEKSPAGMRRFRDGLNDFITRRRQWKLKLEAELKSLDPDSPQAASNRDLINFAARMIKELPANYRMTPPELTFNSRLTLDLGGLTLQLIYFGQGLHTGDDILIYVPEENLLLTGDLFFKGWLIALQDSDAEIEQWLDALALVAEPAGGLDIVIPGHGEFLTGKDIQEYYAYLNTLWTEVSRAFKRGDSLADVRKSLVFTQRFPRLGGLNHRYEEQNFHQENIRFLWERLAGAGKTELKIP